MSLPARGGDAAGIAVRNTLSPIRARVKIPRRHRERGHRAGPGGGRVDAISRVLSRGTEVPPVATIHLDLPLPTGSSGLPADSGGPPSNACAEREIPLLLTLLRVGFTEPSRSPVTLVVSYTTVSPLPPIHLHRRCIGGGLFSVALSRGSPRVAVSNHPALWSPDFPRHPFARMTRPPGRLVRRAHILTAIRDPRSAKPQIRPGTGTGTGRPRSVRSGGEISADEYGSHGDAPGRQD